MPETILVRGRYWKNTAESPAAVETRASAAKPSAIDGLIADLGRDNRTEARRAAAEAVARLGPGGRPAIVALLGCAVDPNGELRTAAVKALTEVDSNWPTTTEAHGAIPLLIEALHSRHSSTAEAAARLLVRIGAPAVPELARALASAGDAGPQFWIARALRGIGGGATEAVSALADALKSEFTQTRIAAAEALAAIGQPACSAVPPLTEALRDGFAEVRAAAANCLARFGSAAEPAAPTLLTLLADRDEEVRKAAVGALGSIGPKVVVPLIEIVRSRDVERMNTAVQSWFETVDWFAHLKRESVSAAPFQTARNWFWRNLESMEARESIEDAHESAVKLLGKFGPAAATAVPAIESALSDGNGRVRLAAVQALAAVGGPARSALGRLGELLADGNEAVRTAARSALAAIDAKWQSAPEVIPAMRELSRHLHSSGPPGDLSVSGLAQIGAASVPVLVEGLKSSDRIVRERSATALGSIGPAAREAVPELTAALKDEHQWVQRAAAAALGRITGA